MGVIFEALKAATGEASLHSALGLWRQKVSQAIDAGFLAGGRQFIQAKNSGGQLIDEPQDIVLDTNIAVRGITRPSTAEFQLTVGKTYHLLARGRMVAITAALTEETMVQFVDSANNPIPHGPGLSAPPAVWIPPTRTDPDSDDPVTDVIYTVPPSSVALFGSVVKLRVVSVVGLPTGTIPASGVSVSIIEL